MSDYRDLELTDEKRRRIQEDSTERLDYVLETLEEADQISEDLDWDTELWEGATLEEVIGALVEADGE